ncbi:MAG TPA: TylF/MycF/NovP-related O-methyltransferase [Nitrospira sp.]|nr:TylF/MycF/NovP-related O-methyltransferase [Nitrospira sp.]
MVFRDAIRDVLIHTPVGQYLGYRYCHMFTPAQLGFLVNCITDTAHLPGPIFEIGCAAGVSTVWLNKHMDDIGIEKPYIAIDTFNGFVEEHIQYEASQRGKDAGRFVMKKVFESNKKKWVERTLKRNAVTRVNLFECDATTFDYGKYKDISFALIDVDLYLPVKEVLDKLYPQMAKGGIIVVDDCIGPGLWDGALQAYDEFTRKINLASEIVHRKLGIIRVS